MKKSQRHGIIGGTLAAALLGGAMILAGPARADTQGPDCVSVTKQTPYQGYGYTHIVHIANGCDYEVSCSVASNVDTEPHAVTVPEAESRDVVLRRGSPAREFDANVRCSSR